MTPGSSPSKAPTAKEPTKKLNQFKVPQFKILLLEGVNKSGIELFEKEGFEIESHPKALDPEILKEKIKHVHAVGLRSKTKLTKEILQEAKNLLVIGCFCIGTNQVDLEFAASKGVAVFNSPFSNSRSVAELVTGEIIALYRRMIDDSNVLHSGIVPETYIGNEISGKTLGIVGYGHIGSQLSVIAESLGMRVIFYDITQIMPLGTAKPVNSLETLLKEADIVTLHVPETEVTKLLITEQQLSLMKKDSILINASRGSVVDIKALSNALKSGHLKGAAIDVYPSEPFGNGPGFSTEVQKCSNTILTPHIGGSTEEAQSSIGLEVASALIKFLTVGTSSNAVNFPNCDLRDIPSDPHVVRVLNVHHNVPGVLRQINKILSSYNIERQISDSKGNYAYLMTDIKIDNEDDCESILNSLESIHECIATRFLH